MIETPGSGSDAMDRASLLERMAVLRTEVRALSRQAERIAGRIAASGSADYERVLSELFDGWIARGDARLQVVSFAAACEFGLHLQHQAVRCAAAAKRDGSKAVCALYWAAVRRCRPWRKPSAKVDPPIADPCSCCKRMLLDPRSAAEHPALRPVSETKLVRPSTNHVCEQECDYCHSRWVRRWSAEDPFGNWAPRRPRNDRTTADR